MRTDRKRRSGRRSRIRTALNLPNLLTASRIVLVVPIIWMLVEDQGRPGLADDTLKFVAFAVTVVAGITDYLDGWIARTRNLVTKLGKFLDPVADKLLVCSIFVMFVAEDWVRPWVLVVMLWREMLVMGLRMQLAVEGVTLGSSRWAKYKTIFQLAAIIAVMLSLCVQVVAFSGWLAVPAATVVYYDQMAGALVLISVLFSVISGIEYFLLHWNVLKSV